MGTIMTLRSRMGHRHQHGFRWQIRPWTSTWPLVVTFAIDIYLAIDIHTVPGLSRTIKTNMAFSGSIGQYINVISDGNMAHRHHNDIR